MTNLVSSQLKETKPRSKRLRENTIRIALAGNPNVGKTMIFNALTGANQKVANYPGITVQGKKGQFKIEEYKFTVTDLPGFYGFGTNTAEEEYAKKAFLEENLDLIVNIVDASRLERNLLLTLQLMELKKNMIIILNFMDKVEAEGMKIEINKIQKILGVPVFATSALKSLQPHKLKQFILQAVEADRITEPLLTHYFQTYQFGLIDIIHEIKTFLPSKYHFLPENFLFLLLMLKESLLYHAIPVDYKQKFIQKVYANPVFQNKNIASREEFEEKMDILIIEKEYEFIHHRIYSQVLIDLNEKTSYGKMLEKIDSVLTHQFWGLIIFILVIIALFEITYYVAQPFMDLIDMGVSWIVEFLLRVIPNKIIASFIAEGLVTGIGFVLVFIPQIMFVFMGISVLENSGYLNRIILVTDQYLNRLGVTGQSLAPLVLGFGCNIPGILATKSIKNEKQRMITAMVNPFIPCSARLPVLVLLSAAFFPAYAPIVLSFMYFFGVTIALCSIWVLNKVSVTKEESYLILEMPDLSIPSFKSTIYQTYLYLREFLETAAKWIAISVMIIWILSVTGPSGYIGVNALHDSTLLRESWIYRLGSIIQWFFKPLGWSVSAIIALIFGFVAKEIVIATLSVLYNASSNEALRATLASQFTPAQGFAYMIYITLYMPCVGTLFAMKSQIGKKLTGIAVTFSLTIAWVLAFITQLVLSFIFP